jgi:hypothetical protein
MSDSEEINDETHKVCKGMPKIRGCGERKKLSKFYQDKHGNIKSTCKKCMKRAYKEKVERQKEIEEKVKQYEIGEEEETKSVKSKLTRENVEKKNKIEAGLEYLTEKLEEAEERIEEMREEIEKYRIGKIEDEEYIKDLEGQIRTKDRIIEELEMKNEKNKQKIKSIKEKEKLEI